MGEGGHLARDPEEPVVDQIGGLVEQSEPGRPVVEPAGGQQRLAEHVDGHPDGKRRPFGGALPAPCTVGDRQEKGTRGLVVVAAVGILARQPPAEVAGPGDRCAEYPPGRGTQDRAAPADGMARAAHEPASPTSPWPVHCAPCRNIFRTRWKVMRASSPRSAEPLEVETSRSSWRNWMSLVL